MTECNRCKGVGKVLRSSFVDPSQSLEIICSICKGTGSYVCAEDEIARLRTRVALLEGDLITAGAAWNAACSDIAAMEEKANRSITPTRSELVLLIDYYGNDAAAADAVGADECVAFDDQRIEELSKLLAAIDSGNKGVKL